MRIYKEKLIKALEIMELSPQQAIDIVNMRIEFLCHTHQWEKTGKDFIIFPNDEKSMTNKQKAAKRLEIPRCIVLTKKDIKQIYHISVSIHTKAISVSLILYHDTDKRNQVIKVLESMI